MISNKFRFPGTVALAVLALSLYGLLAGCSSRETRADQAVREGILLLANGAEPKGLDPHLVTGVTENKIISALIEGLVAYHPTDDNLSEPGMATRWEPADGYRTWTFYLREDALWSNGDRVTAHDFVYSFQRMLSPALGAEYADMLYVMEGAEEFHTGTHEDFSRVGVKALDDLTLQIRLVGPTPFFPSMLKHYAWFPVNPRVIEAFGGMTNRTTQWTRPGNYVGNGPFILESWRTNQIVRVVRNPLYWDADTVRLNEIHFFPIDNANTEERAFRAGQIHYANTVPPDLIEFYRQRQPEVLRMEPYLGTYFFRFNTTRPPLNDPRVRRALTLTIDRDLIVRQILRGGQESAHGFTPPGMLGYETPQPLRYDPDEARRLLAEAGFPEGRGFPSLQLLFNTHESHRQIAEAVQEMWRTKLGIQIGLTNQEWKVYLDTQTNMNYDLARAGWIGDFMDPSTFLTMWITGSGNNNTGWSNGLFDGLMSRVAREADPQTRFQLMKEAESILLEDLPIAPVYWYTRIYLIDPRVRGWYPKLLDNRPYKFVHFSD